MGTVIKTIQRDDFPAWDAYVKAHSRATLYHLSGWKNVIENTYGHRTYYLMAIRNDSQSSRFLPRAQRSSNEVVLEHSDNRIVGILPLVHLKHFLFGNNLISMPFCDLGGILANDEEIEKALLTEAINLGKELKVENVELRHTHPLSWLGSNSSTKSVINNPPSATNWVCQTRSHKVRMTLGLMESSQSLMKSLKPRLRTKIRKPLKEGLSPVIGRLDLLDDFYRVFSVNMRDLGSPVHSKKLMKHVLEEFPDRATIVMVFKDDIPVAGSLTVGFKNTLESPWVSALREHRKLYPNCLLYWTMMEHARRNGFTYFEFGRSSPGEGTYKFKNQWGPKPSPLHWHYVSVDGRLIEEETTEKTKFDRAIQYWKKLPVSVTKFLGPMIRKHIGL
jgi:FemAB-related protein (PEP-CTERM system-associated)